MSFRDNKHWFVIVAISLVAVSAVYWMVGVYDQGYVGEEIFIENGAKRVRIDNKSYFVTAVENNTKENAQWVDLLIVSKNIFENTGGFQAPSGSMENLVTELKVSGGVYSRALETPVVIERDDVGKDSGPLKEMFSFAVGVAVFGVLSAVHLRKPETRGKAATLLLKNGREDARVRDVEILATIMKMEEFTVPEVMRKVGTSKATTYRTINDLVDMDLVKKTEESDLSNGRGKPSQIYEFSGDEY